MAYWNNPWSQPFLQSYRQPAPKRLSREELEELLLAQQEPPPQRPAPVGPGDLEGDDRRQYRQQSLWAGLAGMGALIQGDQRAAMGAMGNIEDAQQRVLQGANQRREEEYQRQVEDAQRRAAQTAQRQKVAALYGMYEEVAQDETPAFAAKAEAAARAGSMAELEKMREEKPKRAFVRSKGYDPDLWDANQRAEAELKAEMERLAKQREWEEVEKKKLEEQERIKAAANLADRIAQNENGVLFPPRETPAEAAAKAEAVARVQAKYRTTQGGAAPGQLYKQGEKIVFAIKPDAEHPQGQIIPLAGQPENVGNITYFTLPGGVRMAQNKEHPEWGAYEVPVPIPGEPGYEENRRKVLGLDGGNARGAGPAPNEAPEANHLLNQTVAGLRAGGDDKEALRLLRQQAARFGGKINGYTPEQIFAKAKKLAAGGQ